MKSYYGTISIVFLLAFVLDAVLSSAFSSLNHHIKRQSTRFQTELDFVAKNVAQQACEMAENGLLSAKETLNAVTEGMVATLVVTNQALSEVCEQTALSIGNLKERLQSSEPVTAEVKGPSLTGPQASALGKQALQNVHQTLRSGSWKFVKHQDGVSLWTLRGAGEFVCVKAEAILDAPIETLYSLFLDNSRVPEYNDHCQQIRDLEVYPRQGTKITWSASGKYGPFKARDFCTLVYFSVLKDGSRAIVSRPWRESHHLKKADEAYVRSEVLLSGHFLRALETDPKRTHILTISQIDPGGGVTKNPAALKIINTLSVSGPIDFVKKLEAAAQMPGDCTIPHQAVLATSTSPSSLYQQIMQTFGLFHRSLLAKL